MDLEINLVGTDNASAVMDSAATSADNLATSADAAASSVDHLGQADLSGTAAGMDSVAASADNASGSIQGGGRAIGAMGAQVAKDVPGMTAAFGSMAPVMGRLTAQAALTGQGFGTIAKLAPALAIVGAATKVIGDNMKLSAETAKQNAENTKEWTAALEKGGNAVDSMVAKVKAAGELKVTLFGLDGVGDLVPVLARAGVTAEQFFNAVTAGEPGLHKARASMPLCMHLRA